MSDSPAGRTLRERWRESLVLRQASLAALVAAMTSLAAGLGAFWVSRITLQDQIHVRLSHHFEEQQSAITGFFELQQRTLRELTSEAQLGGVLRNHARGLTSTAEFQDSARLLLEAVASRRGVLGLWLSNPAGELLVSAGDAGADARAVRPVGMDVSEAAIWLGPLDSRDGRSVVELASTVRDAAGRPLAFVQMRADMTRVEQVLRAAGDEGLLGDYRIASRAGGGLRVLPAGPEQVPAAIAEALDLAAANNYGFYRLPGERPQLLMSRPLGANGALLRGWGMVASAPVDHLYAPMERASRITAIVVAAILGIGAWAVFVATRLLGRPLGQLDRAAAQISAGDLAARAPVHVPDEVGRIGETLNELTSLAAGERARTAQRVAERTAELQHHNEALRARNDELDQFAYAAAHDLRAPLRAIENLATWLGEGKEAALGERAGEDLRTIRTRVRQMERLLADLLEYARIGQREERSVEVETAELVQEIVDGLEVPVDVHIEVASDLPRVRAPEAALHTVLQNLIGNAIQHRDPARKTTIRVSAEDGAAAVEFVVADDGPGIPSEFHARIFERFQSLKPRGDGTSSGMGLAIVKKTVEHFGGEIGVESSPDAGATFRVVWPKTALS